MLKTLRKQVAKHKNLPLYVIFQDPSLEEMATTYPTNKEDLAAVNGVGHGAKSISFGKEFVDLIQKYVDENDIETATDVVESRPVNNRNQNLHHPAKLTARSTLKKLLSLRGLPFEN